MAYRNLDEFLARLEQDGDAVEGGASNNTDRARIFNTPSGNVRIVRDLFGTRRRIEMALRVRALDLIAERLEPLLELGKPGAFSTMIGQAMSMFTSLRVTQNRRALQSYHRVEVAAWRGELCALMNGADTTFLSASLMSGGVNATLRPVQVRLSETQLLVESAPSRSVGEQVALVFGGDPAFLFAVLAPLPDLLHRSYLASWLRERPLDMMRLPELDFDVPANVEAVVVGTVTEAGVGEANTYLDPDTMRLVVDPSAVYTNANAIYLDWTSTERDVVRDALFTMFQPALRRLLPGLNDVQIRDFIGDISTQYLRARGAAVRRTED